MLFRKLVFAAVAVGIISGLVLGIVQQFSVTPTILAAEVYEIADEAPVSTQHHAQAAHQHDAEAWAPEDGVERANAEVLMGGDNDSLVRGCVGFEDDVTAYLASSTIVPLSAKAPDEPLTTEISGKLHPVARTSSRT